ncbi:MAG: undecaprenyldiphospho-muramoylpentapeptide beta-N-acetylglucosaminyltransferase [Rhodospirillaceae bacterium]|nr:undecaprenyldiphospho-muramoylpentapeptide beta-N-acetylglucosaminyltransferase [Rhodospirillaceae bacterium]
MFPAEALAGELMAHSVAVALITDRRGEAFGKRLAGVSVHQVSAGMLAGGVVQKAEGALRLAVGLFQARAVLARLRPQVVVGFGGYPSVPTVLAAARTGIATVLHEQNAVLGRANRLLAPRAARLATAFARIETFGRVPPERIVYTGNPVRPAIAAVGADPFPTPTSDGPLNLLVLGGSQGARVFARVVPAAVALLPETLRRRLVIAQQCRPEDLEAARAAYAGQALEPTLSPFFDDMPARLAAAHLVIARAGASTVAELGAAGRPAILVPYPFATDDHQTANARALVEADGAWLMPERTLTPETLAARLRGLLLDPPALAHAAAAARGAGRRDAAACLARAVMEFLPEDGARPAPREAAA